jgi:hypothetical protein
VKAYESCKAEKPPATSNQQLGRDWEEEKSKRKREARTEERVREALRAVIVSGSLGNWSEKLSMGSVPG